MSRGRLVLLSTSPRVAPGLLSFDAWSVLGSGHVVARSEQHPALPYLGLAGIEVEFAVGNQHARALLTQALTSEEPVVYLLDPDGEDGLTRELSALLLGGVGTDELPEVEVLPGSYDLPGARLLEVVAVMDRLRSPGGCPWDAVQTHESLVTYLLEETYETMEAIETGDRAHLREELGDLLLQVAFHARIAQENPEGAWDVDDVAGDLVDKLVRRHPHVFGPQASDGARSGVGHHTDAAPDAEHLERTWDAAKAAEKGRTSVTDGVPMALPALSLATKLIGRTRRAGVEVALPGEAGSLGARLFALAGEAQRAGQDPESELRAAARAYTRAVRAAESGDRGGGGGTGGADIVSE